MIAPWTVVFLCSAAALVRVRLSGSRLGLNWYEYRPGLFLFLLSLTVYLATFRWHGGDDIPNSLLPFALLRHGTLSMDPFRDWFAQKGLIPDFTVPARGHLMSVYPIGPGILALPVFALPVLAGAEPSELLLHNLSKISASLICALSVLLFYRICSQRASHRWAACLSLLYAFGTYAFSVCSQALYQHGPALLALAIGLNGLLDRDKKPSHAFLSGFGFALASVLRPDAALFFGATLLYFLAHRRGQLIHFLLGSAVPLCLTASYWLYYVGRLRPPESQFQAGLFGALQTQALWATLLSPTRGLIFFMPAGLFGFWGMARAWRDRELSVPYLLAACVATWVFFGFRSSWTAGQTFGNRYFALICLILALFCSDIERDICASRRLRALWAAAFAVSVMVHATGAFFNWPGSFSIPAQMAAIWNLQLFPLANLVASSGPLGALGNPARAALALAALALTAGMAFFIYARGSAQSLTSDG